MRKMLYELATEMVAKEIPLDMAVREFEAAYLIEAVSKNGGNCSATARQLGIHRNTLSRKIGPRSKDNMSYNGASCQGASVG